MSEGVSIQRTAFSVVAPNPSADQVQIHFEVSGSAPIHIDLVDLTGRVAAVLLDETRGPGFHHLDWNGNVNGRALRPGLYFVRLNGPDGQSVKRLSRVR